MKTILIAAGALVVGAALGIVFCEATIRHLRKRVKELRLARSTENPELAKLSNREKALYYQMLDELENGETRRCAPSKKKNILRSVTRFLFVTTQICAIIWVSWTYIIATYSTIALGQPFPVEELSRQAIITLLGMSGLKVVENIFEHNEGVVFGKSRTEDDPPDEGGEGEVG